MTGLSPLYAIADASFGDPVVIAQQLFAGGAELVQLRNKFAHSGIVYKQAEAIVAAAPNGAQVLVNDRVDIARMVGADGAHVGQDDLPTLEARNILGQSGVLGLSTHSRTEAVECDIEVVDYIALGPIFSTTTKMEVCNSLGLDVLATVCEIAQKPVVAIGGITVDNAPDVLAAGATSVAIISDLLAHTDIEARTHDFLNKLGGIHF